MPKNKFTAFTMRIGTTKFFGEDLLFAIFWRRVSGGSGEEWLYCVAISLDTEEQRVLTASECEHESLSFGRDGIFERRGERLEEDHAVLD